MVPAAGRTVVSATQLSRWGSTTARTAGDTSPVKANRTRRRTTPSSSARSSSWGRPSSGVAPSAS